MTPGQRRSEATRLLAIAIDFQGENDLAVAGELLWGALNHLAAAVAEHHILSTGGRRMTRKEVMLHLQSTGPAAPSLATQFDNIAALHGNFYNGHISPVDLGSAVNAGIRFIDYLRNRAEVLAIR